MNPDVEVYGDQTGRVDLEAVRIRHQNMPSADDIGTLIAEIETLRRALRDTQAWLDVSEQKRQILEWNQRQPWEGSRS